MQYEGICYNINFVSDVVCRLDFASPVNDLRKTMPKAIYDVVRKYYPIAEPGDVFGTELGINPVSGAPSINRIPSKQWTFWARDRKSKCTIEAENIIFALKRYNVFEDLYKSVVDILKIVMNHYTENQGKRLGLRYVNNIPLKDNYDWIDDKYTSVLSVCRDEKTTRLITTLEYAELEEDLNVRLNYGFNNPDYPSVIKNDEFLIDIDAYTQGIIYEEDIEQYINDMHFQVQDCFEKMITDAFREANR